MGIQIRIDETVYNAAKNVASAEYRSIPHQIEFWARIGKCALDNPNLPVKFLKELLISKQTNRSLAEPFYYKGKSDGNYQTNASL